MELMELIEKKTQPVEKSNVPDKKWYIENDAYFLGNPRDEAGKLPLGVYIFQLSQERGPYLQRIEDEFTFNYKIYGKEDAFIERAVKTYHNTVGNFGILLNGIKGTGKTVTGKIISNKLRLPVILIQANYGGIIGQYLSGIGQDVVAFIDEYEKVFVDVDSNGRSIDRGALLSIMDGALGGNNRVVFMLTTNNLFVNENLISRPGRIRYIKNFAQLPLSIINEIVDDILVYPELKEQVVEDLSTMQLITIDIVKAVLEEVNIHHELPRQFFDIFNSKLLDMRANVILISKDGVSLAEKDRIAWYRTKTNFKADIASLKKVVGLALYVDNSAVEIGRLIDVSKDSRVKCLWGTDKWIQKPGTDPEEDEKEEIMEERVYIVEEVRDMHESFVSAM